MYDENKLFKNDQQEQNATGCLIKDLKPLLLACSGDDVTSPIIKKNLEEAGFDEAITNPLTTAYITNKIIPMIIKNEEAIT
jgi:hypothetical protein